MFDAAVPATVPCGRTRRKVGGVLSAGMVPLAEELLIEANMSLTGTCPVDSSVKGRGLK